MATGPPVRVRGTRCLPAAHLVHEHIPNPLDEKILFTFIHQRVLLPLQDPLKELAMDTDQLIQTGEELLHHLLLKEQVGRHAPAVHVAHDLECAEVVELRLHQLWGRDKAQWSGMLSSRILLQSVSAATKSPILS